LPTGSLNLDPWIVAHGIGKKTKTLEMIVAVRPNNQQPLSLFQSVSTLQAYHPNRVSLNVVTGGFPIELKRYGDYLESKKKRYERTK